MDIKIIIDIKIQLHIETKINVKLLIDTKMKFTRIFESITKLKLTWSSNCKSSSMFKPKFEKILNLEPSSKSLGCPNQIRYPNKMAIRTNIIIKTIIIIIKMSININSLNVIFPFKSDYTSQLA